MGLVTRSFDFVNGTLANGDEVDTDLNKLYTELNGNIDDTNIKPSAGIQGSKLAAGSVGTTQLTDDSVDNNKLKDDAAVDVNRAVTRDHIRDAAINSAKILALAIGLDRLKTTNFVYNNALAAGYFDIDTGLPVALWTPLALYHNVTPVRDDAWVIFVYTDGTANWKMHLKSSPVFPALNVTFNFTQMFLSKLGI